MLEYWVCRNEIYFNLDALIKNKNQTIIHFIYQYCIFRS